MKKLTMHTSNEQLQCGSDVVKVWGGRLRGAQIHEGLSVKGLLGVDAQGLAQGFRLGWEQESHLALISER